MATKFIRYPSELKEGEWGYTRQGAVYFCYAQGLVQRMDRSAGPSSPIVSAGGVQPDWNQTDAAQPNYIQHKPTILVPTQANWTQSDTTQLDYIKNKPTILTPVQADWTQSDPGQLDYIKNKPILTGTNAATITRSLVPPSGLNLSTIGDIDWIKWGYIGMRPLNNAVNRTRKWNGHVLSELYYSPGTTTYDYDGIPCSWRDGDYNVLAYSNVLKSYFNTFVGSGFHLLAPASSITRTLYLWLGVYNCTAQLTLWYDNLLINQDTITYSGATDVCYTIVYSSNNIPYLNARWWYVSGAGGNMTIQAAALTKT